MTDLDVKAILERAKSLSIDLRDWQEALRVDSGWEPDLVLNEVGGAATMLETDVPALCAEVEWLQSEVDIAKTTAFELGGEKDIVELREQLAASAEALRQAKEALVDSAKELLAVKADEARAGEDYREKLAERQGMVEHWIRQLKQALTERDAVSARSARLESLLSRWVDRGFPMGGADLYDATKEALAPTPTGGKEHE